MGILKSSKASKKKAEKSVAEAQSSNDSSKKIDNITSEQVNSTDNKSKDKRPASLKTPLNNEASTTSSKTVSPALSPRRRPTMSEKNVEKNIFIAKSLRIDFINWWNVYVNRYHPYIFWTVVLLIMSRVLYNHKSSFHNREMISSYTIELYKRIFFPSAETEDIFGIAFYRGFVLPFLLVSFLILYYTKGARSVYLVDFATFTPPESWKVSRKDIITIMENQGIYHKESIDFMDRVLSRSGTSDATYWPPTQIKFLNQKGPPTCFMEAARKESEVVITGCIDELVEKIGINLKKDVDFLVINCSLFSPTPSLCAMVCNHYGMPSSIRSYNLSGMGCSAGLISIDLAKELLENNPGTSALVVSTENLTLNQYNGKEKGMLLQNTLFRVGGAAIYLTNKMSYSLLSKYKLMYCVRTQNTAQNAYEAVYECEDDVGNKGIRLSKDIVKVAGQCLTKNLTLLGPYILPIREQIKVVFSMVSKAVLEAMKKKLIKMNRQDFAEKLPKVDTHYVPDFKRSIDHFCIHAGGRAVIEGIQKNLQLEDHHTEASFQTLYGFGNTSSSSIWYELDWIERHYTMTSGERVLQLGFGSGFKCNSAVWLRLRTDDIKEEDAKNSNDFWASDDSNPKGHISTVKPKQN